MTCQFLIPSNLRSYLIVFKLLLLSILLFYFSLDNVYANSDSLTYRQWRKEIMKEQITKLKNGALLVRLQTKSNSVNALRENGQTEKANQVRDNQNELNKTIIEAFKTNYNFSPVYFFFSDFSDTVRQHKLNDVVFLNDDLLPDNSVKLNSTSFLTCEFGYIQQDTSQYLNGTYLAYTDDGLKRKENYYGSVNTMSQAFIVMSDQFIQLTDPFPYYVKLTSANPNQRKMNTKIKKLNSQLIGYYNKCNQK